MRKMKKYLLFLVAAAGLVFANSGCTSKKAEVDQQIVENADVEKIEVDSLDAPAQGVDSSLEAAMGETPTVATPTDVATAAPTIDETSLSADVATTPTDSLTTTTTDTTVSEVTTETTITETPIAPVEATAIDTASITTSANEPLPTATPAPDAVTAEAAPAEVSKSDAGAATSAVSAPKPSGTALKKITSTMPYQSKDGGWINAVYVARPKEKLAEISMKIYGIDKSKELKKIAENSYLKSRSVRAGDKIYYVSPNRPDDSSRTLIYYEDMGMVPETYVAKKGENLRKVSKNLLGYDNAWKEVWSSNIIESKTSLKDGDTIRYWKTADSTAAATPAPPAIATTLPPTGGATLIDSAQAPPPTAQTAPPAAEATAMLPPPPTDANANLPPPPPAEAVAAAQVEPAATTEPSLPPPPAPEELAAPPPPPPEAIEGATAAPKQKINLDEAVAEEEMEEGEGLDSDTLMSMGALGILVALMAFVIIRKKKQKAAQMADTEMNA